MSVSKNRGNNSKIQDSSLSDNFKNELKNNNKEASKIFNLRRSISFGGFLNETIKFQRESLNLKFSKLPSFNNDTNCNSKKKELKIKFKEIIDSVTTTSLDIFFKPFKSKLLIIKIIWILYLLNRWV